MTFNPNLIFYQYPVAGVFYFGGKSNDFNPVVGAKNHLGAHPLIRWGKKL
jgi:hypothetical protein